MYKYIRRIFRSITILCLLLMYAQFLQAQSKADQARRNYWAEIDFDGRARDFLINLPPLYFNTAKELPLVIALHGAGGNGGLFERQYHFSEKADSAGFIAVYPNGLKGESSLSFRTWNAGECCGFAIQSKVDDVAFISQLIDTLTQKYRINRRRVYVTGMSNGGMLAYKLAAEIPHKIAAIAPVSCTMVYDPPAVQSIPVPVIHFHSLRDNIVAYEGKDHFLGYRFPPVDSVLRVWAARNKCSPAARTIRGSGFKKTEWLDSGKRPLVIAYITTDGGHSWPGGSRTRPVAQAPSKMINANALIWDFFRQFELPETALNR